MTRALFSSGDLIADRRAQYAEMLEEGGDIGGAADLMAQALDLVPGWVAGWALLAAYREAAGNLAGAVEAWRRLAVLDTLGRFGARLKLAAHGQDEAAPATDAAYVQALFDDYAWEFEAALVDRLGYRVPALLDSRLAAHGPQRFERALDLGCGTGLMGARLRKKVAVLEGVDLSGGMIGEARRKDIYDRLTVAEMLEFLAVYEGGVDLVTAADVFVYSGALPPVFAAVARVLVPGGLFAFSVETHAGPEACVLRQSLRYAHAPGAALAALVAAGFSVLSAGPDVLRQDRGAPVAGLVVLARRNGGANGGEG